MGNAIIVGLGGAGMAMAAAPALQQLGRVFAINTDSQSLSNSSISNKLMIGESTSSGGAVLNQAQALRAAEKSRESLDDLFTSDTNRAVLIAGLGGVTGTGVIHFLCEIAAAKNIPVLAAVTVPSKLEGNRRHMALQAVEKLKADSITVIVYDHECGWESADTSMLELMAKAERSVCSGILKEFEV